MRKTVPIDSEYTIIKDNANFGPLIDWRNLQQNMTMA